MSDQLIVDRLVDGMKADQVRDWLKSRLNNCVRISAGRTGAEKHGWLEDAAYFTAAIALIDWTEAYKLEVN